MKIVENIKIKNKISANNIDIIDNHLAFYVIKDLSYKQKAFYNTALKNGLKPEIIKMGEAKLISRLRKAKVLIASDFLPFAYIKPSNQTLVNTLEKEHYNTTDYRFSQIDIFLTNNDLIEKLIIESKIKLIKQIEILAVQLEPPLSNINNHNSDSNLILVGQELKTKNSDFIDYVRYKYNKDKILMFENASAEMLTNVTPETTVFISNLADADFILEKTTNVKSYKEENGQIKIINISPRINKIATDQALDKIFDFKSAVKKNVLIYTAMLENVRIRNEHSKLITYVKEELNAVPVLVDKINAGFSHDTLPIVGRTGPLLKTNQKEAYNFEFQRLFSHLNPICVIDFAMYSDFWQKIFINAPASIKQIVFQNYIIDDEKTFDNNRRQQITRNFKLFDKVMTFNENIGNKNQMYFQDYILVKKNFEVDLDKIKQDSEKYLKIMELYKKERKKFLNKQNMTKDIYQFKTKNYIDVFNRDPEFEELCVQRVLEHAHYATNNNVFVVYTRSFNLNINRLIKAFIDLLDNCLEPRRLKLWLIASDPNFYVKVPQKYDTSIVFFDTVSHSNFYTQNAKYYINLENPTGYVENNIVFAKNINKPIINITATKMEDYPGIIQVEQNRYYIYDEILKLLGTTTALFDHIQIDKE